MPKISDIQETPNPNAVKFILREPVTSGVARQFGSPDQAHTDDLARSLFEVGSVASVFYMDNMITVEKEDAADRNADVDRGNAQAGSRSGFRSDRGIDSVSFFCHQRTEKQSGTKPAAPAFFWSHPLVFSQSVEVHNETFPSPLRLHSAERTNY